MVSLVFFFLFFFFLFVSSAVPISAQVPAGGADTPAAKPPSPKPWMNTALTPEKRAQLLIHEMTLDEKLTQIHMMDTREHPRMIQGIERLGIPGFKITNGPVGAGPGDSRQGQPATALPSALALAAAWDTDLAATYGKIAGQESVDWGNSLLEAPGVNIARVPQNGRNFEYFGEDPYLAARLVVPEIKAIEAQGIIAEVKHYAANNQEADRKTVNEIVDERTLREIYLPAFEAAIKEGAPGAIMCAYPSVNGQFGCENTHTLKDILRGEWGFKGFVQSDYTATHTVVPAALAGLDLAMKHDVWSDEAMKAAITSGKLDESVVDTMLIRRYTQMFRLGILDHPRPVAPIPAEQDGAVARAIAEQSAVLLKNSGKQPLLPLQAKEIHSIAVIGPYAGAAHTGGGGSSKVAPLYTVTPVDGIKNAFKNLGAAAIKVDYNDGADPAAAAALAKSSDVALVMVGNVDREGRDRLNLALPDNQDQLVSAVAAANPRTVVILKTGGPVLMPWLDQAPAVLEAWYPGEEDGNVVADLLFGNASPSGKLPMTFPKAEGDAPAHTPQQYPGVNGTATYSEGLLVGYRWYDAQNIAPLFPFGYGLSYTTFAFSKLSVSPQSLKPASDGDLRVSLAVTNSGPRSGAEVVQVYIAAPRDSGEPPKQLKGFAKVSLQPGETKQVSLTLDRRAFSIWDTRTSQWTVIPGNYSVLVGDSSRDLPLKGSVTVH